MKKYLTVFLFFAILFFGLFLRTFGLDKSPPSVNWDEASIGYNSYSILKTGQDEYGAKWPLYIRSFDDYKSAIPSYLIIPFIALMGLNDISIRLVSVIAGLCTILLIFLISRKVFNSTTVGLLASFYMAISPFAVHFSRVLFESNIALTFFLTGFLLFLYREKRYRLFFSTIFFILSLYTYHSYKALVPLFALILLTLSHKRLKLTKQNISFVLFVAVLLLPLIFSTLNGSSLARFSTTSIFTLWPPPIAQVLNNQHNINFWNLILHNNSFYFLWELGGRYLAYFSPSNLFLLEAVEPNLRIPYLAIFYPFMFIFWVVGLVYGFSNFKKYEEFLLVIILAPIPSVLTWNWFQSVRVLPLFAFFVILIGLGTKLVFDVIILETRKIKLNQVYKRIFLYFCLTVFGIWSSFYLMDSLIVIIPDKYSGDWQPGFKQSIPIIASLQNNYDQIIIESPQAQPYIFTLFYSSYSPQKYLNEIDFTKISKSPRDFYDFGKFKFRKIYWPEDRYSHRILFMGTTSDLPEQDIKNTPNARMIKDILSKDGNVSVRIVAID